MILTCKKCGYKWKSRRESPQRCANKKCRCRNWDAYKKRGKRHSIDALEPKSLLYSPNLGRMIIVMYSTCTYQKGYAKTLGISEQSIAQSIRSLKQFNLLNEKMSHGKKLYELKHEEFKRICMNVLEEKINLYFKKEIDRLKNSVNYDRFKSNDFTIDISYVEERINREIKKLEIEKERYIKKLKKKIPSTNFTNFLYSYYWKHINCLAVPFIDVIKEYLGEVQYL